MSDQVGMMPATQISVKPNTPVRRELSGSSNTANGDLYNPDLTALAMSNLVNSTPEYSDTNPNWRNQPSTVPQEGNWGNEIAPQPERPTLNFRQQVDTGTFGTMSGVIYNGPEEAKKKELAQSRQTIAGMPGYNQPTQPVVPEYSDRPSNMPDVSRMLAERQLGQQALANQQFEQMGSSSSIRHQQIMAERRNEAGRITQEIKQIKQIDATMPKGLSDSAGHSALVRTSFAQIMDSALGTISQLVGTARTDTQRKKRGYDAFRLDLQRRALMAQQRQGPVGPDSAGKERKSTATNLESNSERAAFDHDMGEALENSADPQM